MRLFDIFNEKKGVALAMAPGFFRKFAYIGALGALEECKVYNIKAVTGASAGAIVSGKKYFAFVTALCDNVLNLISWLTVGFVASGKSPIDLTEELFTLERKDFWDPGGLLLPLGLLQGKKMIDTFNKR